MRRKDLDDLRDYWQGSSLGFDTVVAEAYRLRKEIEEMRYALRQIQSNCGDSEGVWQIAEDGLAEAKEEVAE